MASLPSETIILEHLLAPEKLLNRKHNSRPREHCYLLLIPFSQSDPFLNFLLSFSMKNYKVTDTKEVCMCNFLTSGY